MSMRALARLRARPAALVAVGYMFVTNLDSIFVIPLLPVLHGGTPAAIARDVALALSLRLGASLLLSLVPRGGGGNELQERLRAATPDAPASAPLPLGGAPTADTAGTAAPAAGAGAPDTGAPAPQR